MLDSNVMVPNLIDGRFFVSPVLGCRGACSYCYLCLHDYQHPIKNKLSINDFRNTASNCTDFVFGKNGTIISVGAWGDIFPDEYPDLIDHSVKTIIELLKWGNPVQIMSKYALPLEYVQRIANSVQYAGQLLYSTTITTIENWRNVEPLTASPHDRLSVCNCFHNHGIPTNVLLKPFFTEITGLEIESIADLLIEYEVDYCTVGILYWDENIIRRIRNNLFLRDKLQLPVTANDRYLDCDGYQAMKTTDVLSLRGYVEYLRSQGISAYLKSSCVNANILKAPNPSGYYYSQNEYCINCGNCGSTKIYPL